MENEKLDLKDFMEVISRRRKVIFRVLAVAVVLAIIYNILASPIYEANFDVRVNPRGVNEETGSLGQVILSEDQQTKLNTTAEIVKSRYVLETVINQVYKGVPEEQRPDFKTIEKNIAVMPIKNTSMLNIAVQAHSPEESQNIANTLVKVFLQRMTDLAQTQGKDTRIFTGQRLEEARRDLDKAEKELTAYKKDNKTISVSDQTKNFMEQQAALKILEIDNQLAVNAAQAKMADVKGQLTQQNPGFVADSPLIQQYKSKLAEQESDLIIAKSDYTDNHPKVVGLKANIAETQAKLNAEVSRVVKAEAPSSNVVYQGMQQARIQAETDMAVALAQQQALKVAQAQSEVELKAIPDREQGLAHQLRDYTVAEEAYVALAKRYDQARIDEVMQPSDVQVVDMPTLPDNPIGPRKAMDIIFAIVLGLMVGVTSAFITDHFRKTIDTAEDAKRYLGLRVIGSIPSYDMYIPTKQDSLWQKIGFWRKPKSGGVNYG